MSDVSHPELMRAFELIERDNLDQARTILDTYLETHQTDADAWWLYAHAVTDAMDAQDALRHVLQLDPNYPGAKALLNESEQVLMSKPASGITRLTPRPTPIGTDETIPDFLNQLDEDDDSIDEDEFDEFDDDIPATTERRPRRIFILAAAAITIVLIVVAAVLLNSARQTRDVTSTTPTNAVATNVISNATTAPTSSVVTTDEPVTTSESLPQPTTEANGDFTNVYSALTDFTVIENSAGIETTALGETFLISVCNDPSGNLVRTTIDVLDKMAALSGEFVENADYIGARILNCQRDNLLLLTLAASIDDARAFAEGTLSAAEFQTKLQRITN